MSIPPYAAHTYSNLILSARFFVYCINLPLRVFNILNVYFFFLYKFRNDALYEPFFL
jgi:hypothetical protein